MENKMYIYDDAGNEIEMEILFTFESEDYSKNYVLYYNPNDEEDQVFVSSFDDEGNLLDVTDAEEWAMVEEVYGAFIEDEEKNAS
jgi:Protein of unknown function (DUF1292).